APGTRWWWPAGRSRSRWAQLPWGASCLFLFLGRVLARAGAGGVRRHGDGAEREGPAAGDEHDDAAVAGSGTGRSGDGDRVRGVVRHGEEGDGLVDADDVGGGRRGALPRGGALDGLADHCGDPGPERPPQLFDLVGREVVHWNSPLTVWAMGSPERRVIDQRVSM